MNGKIITILTALLVCLFISGNVLAEDEEKVDWGDQQERSMIRQRKISPEFIERTLDQIAEENPAEAEELRKLRDQDTQRFEDIMRDRFRQSFRERFEKHREEQQLEKRRGRRMQSPDDGKERPGMEQMRQKAETHLKWLKENYPAEAEKLENLKFEQPELYLRRVGLSMRKYRPIQEAEKINPAYAKVLKEDIELKERRDEIMAEMSRASGKDKKALAAELQTVVSQRYDIIVKKKQLAYEYLLKKLEKLKAEVKENEAEVQKWKDADFKNKNVESRVKELLGDMKDFSWD